MAKFKNPVNKIKLHEINYAIDKTVSYSQYSIWRKCPYQWYLNYVKGEAVYTPTIHTVFGTSNNTALTDALLESIILPNIQFASTSS